MFGLEDQKKNKKIDEFVFDLEKDLKNPQKNKDLKEKIEQKIQKIREILRSGESPEEFNQLGLLLHGYTSLLKVLSRFNTKK